MRRELHTGHREPAEAVLSLPVARALVHAALTQQEHWLESWSKEGTLRLEWNGVSKKGVLAPLWDLVWKYGLCRRPRWGVRVGPRVQRPYKGRPGPGDTQRSRRVLLQPNVSVNVAQSCPTQRPHGLSSPDQTRPSFRQARPQTADGLGTWTGPPSGLRGNHLAALPV